MLKHSSILLNVEPSNQNDLMVLTINIDDPTKTGKFVDDCISNIKNPFYSHYMAVKEEMWKDRKTDGAAILKIVGEDRLSTKNADKLSKLSGTIYPLITEEDNKKNLHELLQSIKEALKGKNTSRLVVRNVPKADTYIQSLHDQSIDVPCATQFQYLQDRFVVNFRAHALKSEFISDFCLIYKYYFLPVYQKVKHPIQYQIVANTTQEIEYLHSSEMKKFAEML